MYNKFFGFKEKPFKLVPDPEYLFLSKSHEEALAHLTYAIGHGDGFVEITGEVGTGKTTLCRVFLDNLDETVEAAYIFNPKLDARQLLKAINDELGIDSAPDNTKDLIDSLNRFLIREKAAGKKVLVLIDEAQNLSQEVLEQLRLLSNLETTREKLLQIILVGQPELGDMLSSHRLRQLGQRISINCRLVPLTFQEAKDYIRHRIALASHRAGPPFDQSAYRAIYDYSSGIPRLINIACDRVLLNAYGRNSFRITGRLAREAIRELKRGRPVNRDNRLASRTGLAILAAVSLSLVIVVLYLSSQPVPDAPAIGKTAVSPLPAAGRAPDGDDNKVAAQAPPVASAGMAVDAVKDREPAILPAAEELKLPPETTAAEADQDNGELSPAGETWESSLADSPYVRYLSSLNSRRSRNRALTKILQLWFPDGDMTQLKTRMNNDRIFFQESAEQFGLQVQPVATEADLSLIRSLKLPAVFTFYLPGHSWPKYVAVPYITDEKVYYFSEGQKGPAWEETKLFLQHWSGEAYIVWKDFTDLPVMITDRSTESDILALKKLLRQLGYDRLTMTGKYDLETVKTIKAIQEKYGLHVDGLVGPFTKIALFDESDVFAKPSYEIYASRMENGP